MNNNLIAGLVAATLFFALPVAAQENEKRPSESEQIVTIYTEQTAGFEVQNSVQAPKQVETEFERGRSRLEQRFKKPEKGDELEQSLLIRKF